MNSLVLKSHEMTAEQAQEVWEALRGGLREIQRGNASKLRFEQLYRRAYSLVLNRFGEMLYAGVRKTVSEDLELVRQRVGAQNEDKILKSLTEEWARHRLNMTMVRDVLMYMDRTFCPRAQKPPVFEMGILAFKEEVLLTEQILERMSRRVLAEVQAERDHRLLDRFTIKNVVSMLLEVETPARELYEQAVERPILLATQEFFTQEARAVFAAKNLVDFAKHVEQRLMEEEDRAQACFDDSTRSKLMDVLQEVLITNFAQEMVTDGAFGALAMLRNDNIQDLSRLFRLLSRVPETLDLLRQVILNLIRSMGEALVKEQSSQTEPQKLIQGILNLRSKFFNIVSSALQGERTFSRLVRDAFEYVVNLEPRIAQFLSRYVDDILRKGSAGLASDDAVEQQLEEVIMVFKHISDKDVFEDSYKQLLASRLLSGKGSSDDFEKLMIAKLKAECGHQFTSKLEGMFKNMELSKEINSKFASHLRSSPSFDAEDDMPDLSVNVLTSGFWPFPSSPEMCHLPESVTTRVRQFENFYSTVHSGHRLTWQAALGNASLLCKFKTGVKELLVSTYQMCIMMLYSKRDAYTFAEIQKLTNIPESELQRHILSLAHPKVKILKKEPSVKQVRPDDVFSYNSDFSHPMVRVKVKLLSAASLKSEEKTESSLPEGVIEARKNRVEAAIVRIMKARQKLEHGQLVSEVIKQLSVRFAADPAFIKKRIESLIEREYLERDSNDRRFYLYIA